VRFLLLALLLIGCNRELSLEPVRAPKGWTEVASADPHVALRELGIEYRERKDAAIVSYASPTGDQLRVITVRSQVPLRSLLARLANVRGLGPSPHTQTGQFTVETIASHAALHVGFEIAPEPNDNPDAVERSQLMIASCTPARDRVPSMYDKDPCVRAIHASIDAVRSDSDDWWVYSYIAGLIFAALVIGRWLQLGRRLLPPKGPSGLPVARVR
jgi:hypothetical protein